MKTLNTNQGSINFDKIQYVNYKDTFSTKLSTIVAFLGNMFYIASPYFLLNTFKAFHSSISENMFVIFVFIYVITIFIIMQKNVKEKGFIGFLSILSFIANILLIGMFSSVIM